MTAAQPRFCVFPLALAVRWCRRSRDHLAAGRMMQAIMAAGTAMMWLGYADGEEYSDHWRRRSPLVRRLTDQALADVAAVAGARCAVLALRLPTTAVGRA